MTRISGRWAGIGIAILVVVGLAFAAVNGRSSPPPQATVTPISVESGAPAAEPAVQPVTTVPGVSFGSAGGLVLKFGIVAAILAASLWALRRFTGGGSRAGGKTNAISIADTIMLAQGRALYVVDVGDRAVLIGSTAQQFSPLAEITDPTLLETLRAQPERPAPLTGVASRLESAVRGFNSRRQAALAARRADGTGSDDLVSDRPAPRPRRTHPERTTFAETLSAISAESEPAGAGGHEHDEAATVRLRRARTQPYRIDVDSMSDCSIEPDTGDRLRALAERLRAVRETA